jgi:short subunit dehydrogenase-like uncharacterized protein
VHACGFDSIPSDIGALFVTDHIAKKHNQKTKDVHYYVLKAEGGFSGTFIYLKNVFKISTFY